MLAASRDIADCVKEFKSRKLPLHGLINNIGVENPPDIKSKEGFDVGCCNDNCQSSPACRALLVCT